MYHAVRKKFLKAASWFVLTALSWVVRSNEHDEERPAGEAVSRELEENDMTLMDTMTRPVLTRREQVVLARLDEDVTLEEIARELYVTRNTVKSQVRSVYRKLGISSRAEAVEAKKGLDLR